MHTTIPLSPIDHIFTGIGSYPIEFIFAYEGFINEEKLRSSLENTLSYFPPAASTIKIDEDEKYVFVPHEPGYSLEVVEHKINFDETTKREVFLDPVNTKEGEILTRVRLTNTPGGSVLGISISHAIADGFSYFYFLSSWARIFNNLEIFPPSHDRNLLIKPIKDQGKIDSEEILKYAGLFYDRPRVEIKRDQLIWQTIHLSTAELKSKLTEAQEECESRLSFNDVIVATLWKKYMHEWSKNDDDHMTYISCPFDYRRLLKDFPSTYFGNAVALASTPLSYEHLMEASLGELSMLVRKNIGQVNEEYINAGLNALACLREEYGINSFEKVHVAHPENGLLVTNLSRLPVNQIEFGAGPPVKYEILTPANRGAVILPDADGVQVRVCCPLD